MPLGEAVTGLISGSHGRACWRKRFWRNLSNSRAVAAQICVNGESNLLASFRSAVEEWDFPRPLPNLPMTPKQWVGDIPFKFQSNGWRWANIVNRALLRTRGLSVDDCCHEPSYSFRKIRKSATGWKSSMIFYVGSSSGLITVVVMTFITARWRVVTFVDPCRSNG